MCTHDQDVGLKLVNAILARHRHRCARAERMLFAPHTIHRCATNVVAPHTIQLLSLANLGKVRRR